MNIFSIQLMSANKSEMINNVVRFTGHDEAGSFDILANATRRMTILSLGLAQYVDCDDKSEFLAIQSGLLYFDANKLKIATTQFYHNSDYQKVIENLEKLMNTTIIDENEIKKTSL